MNANNNIIKTQIFHNMKYDLIGHTRSHLDLYGLKFTIS